MIHYYPETQTAQNRILREREREREIVMSGLEYPHSLCLFSTSTMIRVHKSLYLFSIFVAKHMKELRVTIHGISKYC